jgi:protein-S-isoprenylcysteine O-methyltransferase Ste14
MSAQDRDRPNVIVFPPVVLLATIALACALQWRFPIGLRASFDSRWRVAVGGLLLAFGVALTIAAARALTKHGTNVNPSQPTLALATDGIFGWTRNPIYLSGGPLMLGPAIVFGIDWLPVLMVPSLLVLHFGIVRREEQYLAGKFGDEYRRYCALVPRYVPGLAPGHHQETSR